MHWMVGMMMVVALGLVGCSGEADVLVPEAEVRASEEMGALVRAEDASRELPTVLDMREAGDDDMGVARDMSVWDDMSRDMAPDMSWVEPPLTIAIISDMNGSYGSITYGAHVRSAVQWLITEVRPDVVLATGDMVAGQRVGLDYEAMWSAFHEVVTTPLAQANIPFAPTPGNHDASGYARFASEREVFIDQWQARRPAVTFVEDTYYPLRYAFTIGATLFVSLDDTIIAPLDDAQRQWLRQVLEANQGVSTTIVYGHVPLYATAQGREDEALEDEALEAMLVELGVDLFIAGHHHTYYPGRRGPLRLLSMACLGSGPRRLIGESGRSARGVALVTVAGGQITGVESYAGDGWSEAVTRSTLPAMITSHGYTVFRDDL